MIHTKNTTHNIKIEIDTTPVVLDIVKDHILDLHSLQKVAEIHLKNHDLILLNMTEEMINHTQKGIIMMISTLQEDQEEMKAMMIRNIVVIAREITKIMRTSILNILRVSEIPKEHINTVTIDTNLTHQVKA